MHYQHYHSSKAKSNKIKEIEYLVSNSDRDFFSEETTKEKIVGGEI